MLGTCIQGVVGTLLLIGLAQADIIKSYSGGLTEPGTPGGFVQDEIVYPIAPDAAFFGDLWHPGSGKVGGATVGGWLAYAFTARPLDRAGTSWPAVHGLSAGAPLPEFAFAGGQLWRDGGESLGIGNGWFSHSLGRFQGGDGPIDDGDGVIDLHPDLVFHVLVKIYYRPILADRAYITVLAKSPSGTTLHTKFITGDFSFDEFRFRSGHLSSTDDNRWLWGQVVFADEAHEALNAITVDGDGDLLPDIWEEANGLSTSGNSQFTDHDLDNVWAIDEYLTCSDADNPDTDDDGLTDGDEALWGTYPFDPDTDLDGQWDGDELLGFPYYWSDPLSFSNTVGYPREFIGAENFAEGPLLVTTVGSVGFGWGNAHIGQSFVGQDGTPSVWELLTGAEPVMIEQRLLMTNQELRRKFNGPSVLEIIAGTMSGELAASDPEAAQAVYVGTEFVLRNGMDSLAVTLFDSSDTLVLTAGVRTNPASTLREFFIQYADFPEIFSGVSVADDVSQRLVLKALIMDGSTAVLANPSIVHGVGENAAVIELGPSPVQEVSAAGLSASTGGGSGSAEVQNFVVSTKWEAIPGFFRPGERVVLTLGSNVGESRLELGFTNTTPGHQYRVLTTETLLPGSAVPLGGLRFDSFAQQPLFIPNDFSVPSLFLQAERVTPME